MTTVGNICLLRYLRDFRREISPVPPGYDGEVWCISGRGVAGQGTGSGWKQSRDDETPLQGDESRSPKSTAHLDTPLTARVPSTFQLTYEQLIKSTNAQKDRQTDGPTDSQSDKQTNKQRNTQTNPDSGVLEHTLLLHV